MARSWALSLYLLASHLAAPLAGMLLRRRLAKGKEHPERLPERLGQASVARPEGKLIWLHGASVGEAMALQPLIAALAERSDVQFLVTTGTVTSARRMAEVLPDRAVHQFAPVDTAPAVAAFLGHWRPDLAIWSESEIWPRLVTDTARHGVPMAMVNARLSDQSVAKWRRVPAMARALLGSFGMILTQDQPTAGRLGSLGIGAEFAGNLKTLVPEPDCDRSVLATLQGAIGARPAWLAASTHEGEEEIAIEAHRMVLEQHPEALLILAPRHPERGDDLYRLLSDTGLRVARRSTGEALDQTAQVFLADTLGEMGLWYRLAPVTFVGGSLVPRGGHTPFEPIMLGSAVLHGPKVTNFAEAYAALDARGGAVEVTDAPSLARQVGALLQGEGQQTVRARKIQADLQPDVGKIANRLLALMEGGT